MSGIDWLRTVFFAVVCVSAGCTAAPGSNPSTTADPWTVLGEPWIPPGQTADASIAFVGERACIARPRVWNDYYDEASEIIDCGTFANAFAGPQYLPPETATGVNPDRHSDDYLPGQAIGWGHTLYPVGDVTGDRKPDLAIGTRERGRIDLGLEGALVRVDDGNYLVYAGWVLTGTEGPDRAVDCGDVTGDGRADLCTTAGLWAGWVRQNPPPTATWPAMDHVAAGDFAGDGTTGLVLADGGSLWWLSTPGTLAGAVDVGASASAAFTVAGSVTELAVGDLDGDGVVELVVGTETQTLVGRVSASGFAVVFSVPGRADAVVTGDFDGDGATDLAVGGDAEVRWFAGR